MSLHTNDRGFTLLETVVATGILITALAGLAQLFILAAHLTRQTSASGAALAAAQEKLETLRGLAFTYDEGAAAVTAPSLQPSPPTSLDEDQDPYVDWVGGDGQPVPTAAAASYLRRWRVSSLGATVPHSIAIEVCVFRIVNADRDNRAADACLSTIRTRQP
jgi:type II secretory pathway pseudopilin PulG